MDNPFDDNPFDTAVDQEPDPEDQDDDESASLPQHVLDIIDRFQGKHGDVEDETIIIKSKTDVTVWSSIGSDICKILKRVGATAKVWTDGNGVWITVDKSAFKGPHSAFRTGKRRAMSDEQRAAAAARLAEARARRAS